MMRIGIFDGASADWDAFVERQGGWTHFHRYGWREVMRTTLGHETIFLAARVDGALSGVLPLVRVRTALFGHYLVSMPSMILADSSAAATVRRDPRPC